MSDLFEYIYFLENFPSRVLVFDVCFVDGFDRYFLASQLVNTQRDFPKGSLAQQFDKLVKIESRWRDLIILLDVRFYVADQSVSLQGDVVVQHDFLVSVFRIRRHL